MKKRDQKGFTIVELMVANVVFSLVLLAAMAAMVQIGRLYYKGIVTARTQEVTRNALENISQAIQFSNQGIKTPTNGFFCIGPVRYTYLEDTKIDDSTVKHALWRDLPGAGCANNPSAAPNTNMSDDDPCADPTLCTGGKELLSSNMRITNLSISETSPGSELYTINLSLAFGDDDLLEPDPSDPTRTVCKGATTGVEFCAISELSTTVLRRV